MSSENTSPTMAKLMASQAEYHQQRQEQDRINKVLSSLNENQDDRINFRINSEVKAEFDRLCSAQKSTLSKEIKRFIVEAVRRQSIKWMI